MDNKQAEFRQGYSIGKVDSLNNIDFYERTMSDSFFRGYYTGKISQVSPGFASNIENEFISQPKTLDFSEQKMTKSLTTPDRKV